MKINYFNYIIDQETTEMYTDNRARNARSTYFKAQCATIQLHALGVLNLRRSELCRSKMRPRGGQIFLILIMGDGSASILSLFRRKMEQNFQK